MTHGCRAFDFQLNTISNTCSSQAAIRIAPFRENKLNLPGVKVTGIWIYVDSSYFIQMDGKRILVDPVFSKNASPVPDK